MAAWSREDRARELLLHELEESEWDLSEENLEKVSGTLKNYFRSSDEALDFVVEHASYLYERMQEDE